MALEQLSFNRIAETPQIFLNSSMKNGREVLFRFYDPRVMPAFFNILQEHQAERFWNKIDQCYVLGCPHRAISPLRKEGR